MNLSHALSLVDSMEVAGEKITFMWVYSPFPDYEPTEAPGEGIACVDDVGRFMEVLEKEILTYDRKELLPIARGMTRFLLYLSREDGLWHNFLLADGRINRSHPNSVAEFGWWAIRGLRGLAAAYAIFSPRPADRDLIHRVEARIKAAEVHIGHSVERYPLLEETTLGMRPAWLVKNAPDMNSELLIPLTKLHRTGRFDYYGIIKKISEGLMGYQYTAPGHPLNGMYLCFDNIWHNWGNGQAYGLLEAFQVTQDSALLASVERWADSFVPFLLESNYPRRIVMRGNQTYTARSVPQIAYGFSSIYRGLRSLADITGEKTYVERSDKVFQWFKGANIARTQMYQPETGVCFDGIDGPKSVNRNSGAESTIECLLTIGMRGLF
ncbi:MAG: hypothetical protein ACE5HZ_01045 [Fidelibacterota bacterium]